MDELLARHRTEARDLQSRVTQKKKQANKKNRKGVNDECARLEEELRLRQERELAELEGHGPEDGTDAGLEVSSPPTEQLESLALGDNGQAAMGEVEEKLDEETAASNGSLQAPAGKKRNRAKDRLARRAAEQEELARQAENEAHDLPDMKQQERERMLAAMQARGLREKEIRADGHCLYSAVADQLEQLGVSLDAAGQDVDPTAPSYKRIRAAAAAYIAVHPDDFVPFLDEPLEPYLHKIRATGEWGGQLELMALAKTYGMNIHVLQDFGRVEKIGADLNGSELEKTMWLSYYKHGFGLGEHYNSLRKRP